MDDTEVWSAVDRRRHAIVVLVSGLSQSEWDTPSLCDRWTVRDVAAHLTMPLLGLPQLVGLAIRHPGGNNHVIREGSIELARRYDTDQLPRASVNPKPSRFVQVRPLSSDSHVIPPRLQVEP